MVGSTFPQTYAFQHFHRDNPIESTAAAYTSIYPNRSRNYKVRYLAREFERYAVDAGRSSTTRAPTPSTAPRATGSTCAVWRRLRSGARRCSTSSSSCARM